MEQPTDGQVTAVPSAGPRMPQAAPVSEKVTGRRVVAALIDLPELASRPEFSESLSQAGDNPGPLVGEFSIVDSEVRDWPIPRLGTFPGIEYRIRGEFRDGTTELLLAVINRNGTLQIAAWQVLFV